MSSIDPELLATSRDAMREDALNRANYLAIIAWALWEILIELRSHRRTV